MRCQNVPHNNRRCKRTASKIAIIKHVIDEEQQSKLWTCDECFKEKMYSDKLFKEHVIQVTELNNKRSEF